MYKRKNSYSPFYRRYTKGRRTTGRYTPRVARRVIARSRTTEPIHEFKRTFILANAGDDWSYDSSSGYNFVPLTVSLNQLPTYTDFTSLFDQYQIKSACWKFIPHMNVSQVQGPPGTGSLTTPQVARLVTVVDRDDDTSITFPGALQYATLQESLLDKERQRTFTPSILLQTYRTATSTGYSPSEKPVWVDMAQTDVPHYCGKALICDTTANGSNPRTLTILCTVTVACKGTH